MKHISMTELIDFGARVMTIREILDDKGTDPIWLVTGAFFLMRR